MTPTDKDLDTGEDWLGRRGCMAVDLYAGIPVDDYPAAPAWYAKPFGSPPTFVASDTEAVWELAEHRSVATRWPSVGLPIATRKQIAGGDE